MDWARLFRQIKWREDTGKGLQMGQRKELLVLGSRGGWEHLTRCRIGDTVNLFRREAQTPRRLESRPQLHFFPLPSFITIRDPPPNSPLWAGQVQPVYLFNPDHYDSKVSPCSGIVKPCDFLAQLEVGVGWLFAQGLSRCWVFERAWGIIVSHRPAMAQMQALYTYLS
jgi:hypothetical protein